MAATQNENNSSSSIAKWLAIISTALTILLTVVNALLTQKTNRLEEDLKARQLELDSTLRARQLDLDVDKGKLARFTFVQTLFNGVLAQDPSQRTLTINLI